MVLKSVCELVITYKLSKETEHNKLNNNNLIRIWRNTVVQYKVTLLYYSTKDLHIQVHSQSQMWHKINTNKLQNSIYIHTSDKLYNRIYTLKFKLLKFTYRVNPEPVYQPPYPEGQND